MQSFTVIKRDSSIQQFNLCKISEAINKAKNKIKSNQNIENVINSIENQLMLCNDSPIPIENIQDLVEKTLMNPMFDVYDIGKEYIVYRNKRNESRLSDPIKFQNIYYEIPWGPLGYVTYKRTYARSMSSDKKTEEYKDTIHRILNACKKQLNVNFTNDEWNAAFKYMMTLKAFVAGRFLWQLGTKTVDKIGLASLQNCAFVVIDHPIRPFTWTFDMLMLGSGVGFNIQRHNVDKIGTLLDQDIHITRMDTKDADFIVPDSREGWTSLLEKVLEAFFYKGKSFTYSTILIRGAGSIIHGFGGIASGPEDLCIGIDNIQNILRSKRKCKLSSVNCLDIINIIGSIVVAGNIRRSALIAIGDCDDLDYLSAKRWDLGNIPNWRAMSNNSVICDNISQLPDIFWEGYKGNGEPYGLINLKLAKSIGRTKDGSKYPDPSVEGFNPCAEQGLANNETCCLCEIPLPLQTSFEEMCHIATILYRICKHSLLLPCHHKETEAIVHKNMRIGIGITGYMQASEEQKNWLSDLYEYIRAYDVEYSHKIGCNTSVKLTTVKPSGTLSLLAGVTPGAHPGIYQYFIRRIRISASNPLVELCKSNGYDWEYLRNFDGTEDKKTIIISFPCCYPKQTIFAKNMTAISQLEVVKKLQYEWSDNAVSVTIYYKLHELDEIKEWLDKNYDMNLKTVSFLLHNEHGFKQAPYEEITEEQYDLLKSKTKPITSGNIHGELDDSECASGACPIR